MAYDLQTYTNLITIPGMGSITAMGLITELGDFRRFGDPDEYASHLGMCPWEDSTGDTIKTKGMQPRCNHHLRPLLIEAPWHSIRKSRNLFAYYSKHAGGKNAKKAIVKVARKLAMIARGVAISGQPYNEDYQKMKAERFSSGITEQHINKQPNHGQISMPG